jgi:tetratricopeptide (TPR) repeat protein
VVIEPDDRWTGDDRDRRSAEDRPAWEPEVWVDEPAEAMVSPAGAPPEAGQRPTRSRKAVPEEVQLELRGTVDRAQAARVERRLALAVEAYERDRYDDALRTLRPIARLAPTSATVRELLGLTLYRLGKWRPAIRELEAFYALSGSVDQHPVLMDSHRATARWRAVEEVWEQLRQASPPPEVLNEGRIVMAAALADRGDLAGAIELLARVPTRERPPPLYHLRVWYALADLYERAGDLPRARTLFRRVLDQDPALFDTEQRLAALA